MTRRMTNTVKKTMRNTKKFAKRAVCTTRRMFRLRK